MYTVVVAGRVRKSAVAKYQYDNYYALDVQIYSKKLELDVYTAEH